MAFLLLLSSSAYAGFPFSCLRPFVPTFPALAVVLCSCCLFIMSASLLLLPSLLLLSSSANAGFPCSCLRPFVATFPTIAVVLCKCWLPIQLSASPCCYLPYCWIPLVATFPTVAVVLCKCWLPIQFFASLCCYLPHCCCSPLQMLASHTVVCVTLLLPSLLRCRPLQMLASHTVVCVPVLLYLPYCCCRLCKCWLLILLFAFHTVAVVLCHAAIAFRDRLRRPGIGAGTTNRTVIPAHQET